MAFAVEFSGPRNPLSATPVLAPGWLRRTASIAVTRDDLYGSGDLDLRGRTVRAGASCSGPMLIDSAAMRGGVDASGGITSLQVVQGTNPPTPSDLARFVGASTGAGFRKVVAEALGDEARRGTLWHLLVDDLVGAVLVSGVAPQHLEAKLGGGPIEDSAREYADLMRLTMS